QLRDQLASRAVSRHESLDALSRENLTGVDVAFRIGGDHVQAEKLAATFAHAAQPAGDLAVVTIEEPDRVVLDVADVEVLLCLVRRERDASGGSAVGVVPFGAGGGHDEFLDELPI